MRVYRPRSDGYHPIYSVFQEISLHDELLIEPISVPVCQVRVPGSELDGKLNILNRCFDVFRPHLSEHAGVSINIVKRIPMGAGLGGGSSNAGALISWWVATRRLTLSSEMLVGLAATVGADVPFFLTGGTAIVQGIGEQVQSTDIPVPEWYVLVNPNKVSDTRTVYEWFDTRFPNAPDVAATEPNAVPVVFGENSFETVVWELIPELSVLGGWSMATFGKQARLSGSGATVFFEFSDYQAAQQFMGAVGAQFPTMWTSLVYPVGREKN